VLNRPAPIVALVAGTRPEAVKLGPVAAALRSTGRLQPVLVDSGQHDVMVAEALADLGEKIDVRLTISRRSGSQAELSARLTEALDDHYARTAPAAVVVQGDTTTALVAALTAFWRRIPVVHLEAGLRSGDMAAPFPEEANRRLIGQLADLHLAPTGRAAQNLLAEGAEAGRVLVIGNTVVDAVIAVAASGVAHRDPRLEAVEQAETAGLRLVLVTAHRRESWGEPLDRVLAAVRQLAVEFDDIQVVVPAHPNPGVTEQVAAGLADSPRTLVTGPLPYGSLCRLLARSTIVLSDSGGVQEEAPSFGVPVLVLRDVTERTEGIEAGCSRLVGTDPDRILPAARRLLRDPLARAAMTAAGNPYGDGHAAPRAEQAVAWLLGLAGAPPGPAPSSSGHSA
jgi:UDP-N-acetylglucosamine 2-epimerase (non-hydrolysing)